MDTKVPTVLNMPVEEKKEKKKRSYRKKEKTSANPVLESLESVLEPNKKKLKLELVGDEQISDKIIKEIEKVDAMDEKRARKELSKMEIESMQRMSTNLANSVCNAMGSLFDMALKGKGHIKNEFTEDKTLESAIAKQLATITSLLTPRAQILLCTGHDVGSGFLKARTLPPLIEEKENKEIPKEKKKDDQS